MLLRASTLFVRTLREDPADAELPGHAALIRGSYIRRAGSGLHTWLPLGYLVYRKVEAIVREEMLAIGGQELHFPALLPKEPYEATGRWDEYGPNLFRLTDRRNADFLLAPTHEEMFTLAVKDLYTSYKDLPVTLFQIQTKYRDEARPRGGLLRGREFVMKDSYSFALNDDGLAADYAAHREAYIRIFTRIGLPFVIVSATSGAMGGSTSEEFLTPSEHGEDTFVQSPGGYAANVEAVTTPTPEPIPLDTHDASEQIATPDTTTIAALVTLLNREQPRPNRPWVNADMLKHLALKVTEPDGTTRGVVIGVPGDRDVDLQRLEAQFEPAVITPFDDDDFAAYPTLMKGYIGPGPYSDTSEVELTYLLDPHVAEGSCWVIGANKPGYHVINAVYGRDFTAEGTIEAVEIRDGDPAPDGSGPLAKQRGIEIGHIFQLGRKYTEALQFRVLDENGKQVTPTMGSYGIGVSRLVASVAEAAVDDSGLCWPGPLSPVDVHLVIAGKDEAIVQHAETIANELDRHGIDVLLDDRPRVSPGVKFKDAELLGIPLIVVVGKRLADGVVEVRRRATGTSEEVAVADAVSHIVTAVKTA
ncbi:MAG: proline--tRNA ligase [Nitriliruptoraceae bacterium]